MGILMGVQEMKTSAVRSIGFNAFLIVFALFRLRGNHIYGWSMSVKCPRWGCTVFFCRTGSRSLSFFLPFEDFLVFFFSFLGFVLIDG
jgi:hypothetical protein